MIQGQILPSKVLAKRIAKKERVTNSGIIIAEVVQKDPNITAEVLMVGSGVTNILETELLAGQTILFSPHAFQRIAVQDEELILVDCRDILFFFTPEKD